MLIAIAYVAMPAVNELPNGFPADVLWDFRLASLGTHAVIWVTLGPDLRAASVCQRQIGVEHPALAGTGFGTHPHDLVGDLAQPPRDQDLVRGA